VADIADGATVAIAGFGVEEVAPGFTPQEVMALTEMEVAVAPNVRTME
jgi:acyl CoA:acetate/3-ketoacid CoA transferase beta subunit